MIQLQNQHYTNVSEDIQLTVFILFSNSLIDWYLTYYFLAQDNPFVYWSAFVFTQYRQTF